jgi:hypothetical protein
MFRQDPVRRIAFAEDGIDGRREHGLHMKDDGVRVRRVDGGDLIVATLRQDVVGLVHDGLPRELYVLTGERHAVVPFDLAPQVVGDRPAVLADAAVRERRHGLGQIRHFVVLCVERDEFVEDQAVDHILNRILFQDRIELRWIDR